MKTPSDSLFYPSYTFAKSLDPFTHQLDYFMTVGLNSNLKGYTRKKLNLVIMIDASGSMTGPMITEPEKTKVRPLIPHTADGSRKKDCM